MELHSGYISAIMDIDGDQRRENLKGNHVPWEKYFESEEEMISTLKSFEPKKIHILVEYRLISGYAYILGCNKHLNTSRKLSDKQIVQLKRIASEIYKAKLLMNYVY